MKTWLIAASLVLLGLLAVPLSDEITRASIVGSKGYKETGSKFGITVGMRHDEAVRLLSNHGFELFEPPLGPTRPPQRCHGRYYPDDHTVELWLLIDGWRRGNICLVSRSGDVTNFSWDFMWLDL